MIDWDNGLRVKQNDLYLDSRRPRRLCFVSHAHTDHLAAHDRAVGTPQTLAIAKLRTSFASEIALPFGQKYSLPDIEICLYSSGHVLGSAMLHGSVAEGSFLYTGDFKLRPSLTVPPAQPVQADWLIMETTYGKPFFRFPPRQQVINELLDRVAKALANGFQPIVLGYALGKAQELIRILTDAGFPVTEHGAVAMLSSIYEKQGVNPGPRRRYRSADFKGPAALTLEERGVLIAPPNVARSAFIEQFEKRVTMMCSGWALLSGANYRYGVDHVLPLSDHADFDELIELVERVRPKKVLTLHGFAEFADYLRDRGFDATTAKPDPQLRLFN